MQRPKRFLRRLAIVLACAAGASAQVRFAFDPQSTTWTLENGYVSAVFQLAPEGRFTLLELRNAQTGDTWTPPEGAPVSPIRLEVSGSTLDSSTEFRLVNQSTDPIGRRGTRQTIVLEDLGGVGRVQLELEMYAGQPVLRYRVRFRNLQGSRVFVQMLDMLPWQFAAGEHHFRAFRVAQWVAGGTMGNFEPLTLPLERDGPALDLYTGAYGHHCGWLAVRDEAERGLFAGWEFDGRAGAAVQHAGPALQFSSEVLELNRPVGATQEFIAPYAFLGLFRGGWDEAGYRTQRFTEAVLAHPLPDGNFPWVMWDSWGFQKNISESELRRNAQIAARLGIEAVVVDLGWARQIGDWNADPGKFPSGLRALSDYVHSLGMKFGLHFALAEAEPDSPVLMENPDWTSSESYGYFGAVSLCLSHRPVRDWLIGEAIRMIDEYNVDWILQDGENMVKQCTKTSHTHNAKNSNWANAVDGLNYVVSSIQRLRPHVLWENCEDGGNMMTFNMVRRYVTSIAADNSGALTTRQAVHGATYPFPPRYADGYMPEQQLNTYVTRSYMFGGPWIFMNRLTEMSPRDLDFAAREIAVYRRIRTRIRDGKVYHLTARPAEGRIDALESYNPATDSAIVIIHRAGSDAGERNLMLRGLNPRMTYRVTFEGEPQAVAASGEHLMGGFLVSLPELWSARIMYVDPEP